jgi:hypothetical protein
VVLSVIQGIELNTAVMPFSKGRTLQLKISLELSAQSQCVPGWPLLAPIYRWPGLEDPIEFDTDPSYMMVYNTTSLFDYDYTLTFILGLFFQWASTRTDPRGTNTTGLGSHTLISS